ncbi:MAG: DUF413 domain-containing protein [Desulfamplus sp.]
MNSLEQDFKQMHRDYLNKRFEYKKEVDVIKPDFSDEEDELLKKYGHWMFALEQGLIPPITEAQKHFLEVAKYTIPPETAFEKIWSKFKEYKVINIFDSLGWNKDGINKETQTKFDIYGYDRHGYDRNGWSKKGINKETQTKFDTYGYDRHSYNKEGYDRYGYDKNGWSKKGINKETQTKFDIYGYDRHGYNKEGFNKNGYDRDGYNKNGLNRGGYNRSGYDKDGYNKFGYHRDGYDKNGNVCKYVSIKSTVNENTQSESFQRCPRCDGYNPDCYYCDGKGYVY